MELARQLSWPNDSHSKSQIARALEVGRAMLDRPSKQVAEAIEKWHEIDDTLGHRKHAGLGYRSPDQFAQDKVYLTFHQLPYCNV